jgi:N-acetylglucosamine-6-phosphate deacetylase
VRAADPAALDALLELGGGHVRLITMAAEIDGAQALARAATTRGVRVSIGHSYYDASMLAAMHRAGAGALTHLGNALPHGLPKQANPLLAGLLADDYDAMFIGDGLHLSDDLLRLFLRCRGPARLIAVSDASPVAGLPPGRYEALGQAVELRPDGGVFNPAEQHLVGSSRSLLEIVNTLLARDLCGPADCVRMANRNPLALLGLSVSDLPAGASRVRLDPDQHRFVLQGG